MSPSAVHALQRLLRLFRAEPRGVRDHHFGQPDDGIERRAQLVAHAGDDCDLCSLARTFSIAIAAWSAKVVTSSICLSVNGSTVLRVKTSTPVGVPSRSIGTPRTVRTLANPDPTVSLISGSAFVSTT